jgi:hypothetical protein
MRFAPFAIVLTLLVLAGCNKSATTADAPDKKDDDNSPGVHLKDDDIKSMGITMAPAASVNYQPGVAGYGMVTGLDSIAQSDADLVTAEATASQSAAAAARARDLSTGEEAAISREQLQVSEAKAASDQAALALARRKADAAFGLHPPWRSGEARARIMAALASGRTVLVRATFPLGSLGQSAPHSLTVTPLDAGDKSYVTREIWDAPADPAVPGRSFYLLLDGSGLSQGQRVNVTAPAGAAETGVRVPASALVLSASQTWVYVETKPGTFERKAVDISKPMAGGYFESAGSGIAANQSVVTNGAGLLLARETNPSTEAED